MIQLNTVLRHVVRLGVWASVCLLLFTSTAAAISDEQRNVFNSGAFYFDLNPTNVCRVSTSGTAAATGPVYMVGDSITVGAQSALTTAFTGSGLTVEKINGVSGRSVTGVGQGTENGLQAIDNDAKEVETANVIVVALGTNGGDAQSIRDMLTKIREHNTRTTTKIYWANVFSTGASSMDSFNAALTEQSSGLALTELAFTIIDTTITKIELSGDDVHPTTAGQTVFSQTIANALRGGTSTTQTNLGCTCSLSSATNGTNEENERQVWAYFTGNRGLSPEATAGLMGSIAPESGFNPQNTQNDAPAPDGPEIPIDIIRDRWGYGLIQWTSGGRQDNLVAYARETNRSTGDLGLQLDFLWKELSEGYAGPLARLQTLGITVREASDEVTLHFVTPGSVTTEHGTPESRATTLNERGAASQGFFDKYSGQSVSYSGGGGCTGNGTNIDLESTDTTHIQCAEGTQFDSDADGYRNGILHRIKLCSVGGTRVNSQISGSIAQLLAAASSVGLGLDSGGGSFRDMQGQIDIYNSWCSRRGRAPTPPPYPKANWSDYTRCPGAAPPGYSNHQMGLGFDFVCNGALIPMAYSDAQSNPCFQWLISNASSYGLYEFGKGEDRSDSGYEGWHWSVDGN